MGGESVEVLLACPVSRKKPRMRGAVGQVWEVDRTSLYRRSRKLENRRDVPSGTAWDWNAFSGTWLLGKPELTPAGPFQRLLSQTAASEPQPQRYRRGGC